MWAWALLPVSLAVVSSVGIWTVFGIAVSNGTVNLTLEYPYIRYQQVVDLGYASRANTTSFVLGFISAVGISILGNFQKTVVVSVHLLGVFLAFLVGLAYFWIQVWLTYHAEPSHDRKWAGPARIVFCSLCTCLLLVMCVFYNLGYSSASAICEWTLAMCFFVLFAMFSAEFRHINFHNLNVQREALSSSMRVLPMGQVH